MLVTLADIKTFLGINNSESDDVLNLLIDQVSTLIETKVGRNLESDTYTDEEYDGTGISELKLDNFPVTTFTRLQRNDAAKNEDDWEDEEAEDYWVENDTGVITKISRFLSGKYKYRVTYVAGYADIPTDIQYVAMSMISYIYKNRKVVGIKAESLGDHSVTMEEGLMKDSHLTDILNSYRDIPLAELGEGTKDRDDDTPIIH